jgi:kynurenine formamidase
MQGQAEVAEARRFARLGTELRNWGRWGTDDQIGTLNLITPQRIAAAAGLVRRGTVFDLSLALDENGPQPGGNGRYNAQHKMTLRDHGLPAGMAAFDDEVQLALQGSTQWDALAHVGYDGYLYNGVPYDAVTERGAERNSIDHVVDRVVGRGVLLDIGRLLGLDELPGGFEITPDLLDKAEQAAGSQVTGGDIVLVRTGWKRLFERGERDAFMDRSFAPGLGLDTCRWLYERDVAAVATDTQAVEVKPPRDGEATHPVHMVLVRDMGMTMGELFDLEALAADCAGDGVHEFFFCAAPLKITGAVGSPITPLAIK